MMIGDSFDSYLDMTVNLAITVGSGGTVNPLAAAAAANAFQVAAYQLLEMTGLLELFKYAITVKGLIEKALNNKKKEDTGKKDEKEKKSVIKEIREVIANIRQFLKGCKVLSDMLELLENELAKGTAAIEKVLKPLTTICNVVDLGKELQKLLPVIAKAGKAKPPNPKAICDMVTGGGAVIKKIQAFQ